MAKPQEPIPQTPERKSSGSQLWNLLIRGVLAAIVLAIVVPRVVGELQAARSGKGAAKRAAAEKDAGGERARPASAADAAGWRPLSGGGGGGFSAADVMACNRAAQAARRHASQKLPSDLAAAMGAGKGTLVGATADSLKRVNVRARDDARAAAVYEACITERTF
jgi:hypothetical protein